MVQIPRAYGGVCFLTSLITGNYLITRDKEKWHREHYFHDGDMGMHERTWLDTHRQHVGDNLAPNGTPDDGNGRYFFSKGYTIWYL